MSKMLKTLTSKLARMKLEGKQMKNRPAQDGGKKIQTSIGDQIIPHRSCREKEGTMSMLLLSSPLCALSKILLKSEIKG
jgi:hypothetical protein